MTVDKLKQHIALFGGFLGALFLFLQALDINLAWFNQHMILALYGVYKNSYIITKKAKKQE